jgi:dTDP-4-amino-4,6-dideoxygalactose transaminase
VANGTDALEIALEAALRGRGGEVIVPANSFIASSEAITRTGNRVVFADVDPRTFTIDPTDVARRINERTVAVVAVHLYGHPADFDALRGICVRHDLALIEDAAQSHGAEYRGRRTGGLAEVASWSFFPGKNLGAYGDAGAITTNDDDLARLMRMKANHGRLEKYDHVMEGRNSRLDGLQAAVLSVKLKHLGDWICHRRALAALYSSRLHSVGDLVLPYESPDVRHAYHLYVVRTAHRNALRDTLRRKHIATGIHYPTALPRLKAYADHSQHLEEFVAVDVAKELLSLPMADNISLPQGEVVCRAITQFFEDL